MSNKIFEFINLQNGEEDKEKVLENISSNISFRGSNLWILACAIIIASVGLNVNSTAVIIGAMLISPLMGPIVGAGFALGTSNIFLLKKSFKNLLIATGVSLVVSTIYFYISPFKDVQSELLARTAPNIYDVLIAFFGGLVGVIAITRVEKGNPIPGVAIATALMPPLCTAGYGLATFNLSYFLGAFYLYSINCFFICIATFLIIKYLKYPASSSINPRYEKRIRFGITTLMMIMIVPSFYLAYNLLEEKKFTKTVEQFINTEFNEKGFTVIYKKINYNSSPRKVDIAILGKKLSPEEIASYNKLLNEKDIKQTVLTFRTDDADLKSEILSELGKQDASLTEKDVAINNLRTELNKYKISDQSIYQEFEILFPGYKDMSIGKVEKYPETDSAKMQLVVIYTSTTDHAKAKNDNQKAQQWLQKRMSVDEVILLENK